MSETNLQAFVHALYSAHDASESLDHFDLRSEDGASVKEWNRLLKLQRVAFRSLHEVCCRIPVEDLLFEGQDSCGDVNDAMRTSQDGDVSSQSLGREPSPLERASAHRVKRRRNE